MRHGSLFSGIGGFDLAAEWMGWENKFHCEINSFCKQVLKYYWPGAKSYDDIKTTDFKEWNGLIDIVSGGFPCQPYSAAGKRKGKEDDRHLWPYMLNAIREIQPRWVVGENVSGLLNWNKGLVLDEIKADLEAAGFTVIPPLVLPACAVNAPHRRDRVWIVAYSHSDGHQSRRYKKNRFEEGQIESEGYKRKRIWPDVGRVSEQGFASDSTNAGIEGERQEWEDEVHEFKPAANTEKTECKRSRNARSGGGGFTNNSSNGIIANSGLQRSTISEFKAARIKQQGGWEIFPTQSPVCSRDDGFPSGLVPIAVPSKRGGVRKLTQQQTFGRIRNESIKAYGNSVVPQVVFEIFKAIESYETSSQNRNNDK